MKMTHSLDLRNISGSQQYGNLVIWFTQSPTGDSSDSLNFEVTYNGTITEIFNIRKFVHSVSQNPECPRLNNENLAWLIEQNEIGESIQNEIG